MEQVVPDLGRERDHRLDHFARLVEAVRADEPFLASKIEHDVHLLALDAASFDVALDAPPERVEETRAALQRVVGRLLSPSAIVRVQSVPRGDARLSGPTLYERRQALEAADRKARKEKARFDPMVTLAVDVLGASIAEIHAL